MNLTLGCGQITWHRSPREGPTEDSVLADIASAGYDGAPWVGAEHDAADIRAALQRHGLAPAPTYLGADFWDPSQRAAHVESARTLARRSRELGLTELFVAAHGFDFETSLGRTRWQAAAHSLPGDSLSDQQFGELVRTLQAVGEAALEFGVRACYHNHGGTVVEREDEIERLLDATDPEVLFLGPDVGHLAWAGIDVVAFARRHAARIKTMHLKDVDAEVRAQGAAQGWDYEAFERAGIWTEIGTGSVDFPGLFGVLDEHGFEGWLIVETDVTRLSSPRESARVSRENLRALGV